MSTTIASYGTPTGSVYGKLGEVIGTNVGRAYYKIEADTLNDGWGEPRTPTPTPTFTPTPTPTPIITKFFCYLATCTGSVKCDNELKIDWRTNANASVNCVINWARPATVADPVRVFGNNTTSSLTNNETFYNSIVSSSYGATYNIGFSRATSSIDSGSIRLNAFSGGGFEYLSMRGYSSGSSTLALNVENISRNYIYHTRNLSGNSNQTTSGFISQVLSSSYQIITASAANDDYIELLEINDSEGALTFDPVEIKSCNAIIPTPVPNNHRIWLNYDMFGRVSASWFDQTGSFVNTGLLTGVPYATCDATDGVCIRSGSLNLTYGTNYRIQYSCSYNNDPRSASYQIDATTNINGEYSFVYADTYGIHRNATSATGVSNTTIYAVVCGSSIISIAKGNATISGRIC